MTQQDKFTEEDIEDDGRIKRVCGRKLANIARRKSPELFEYFKEVCDEKGVTPEDRFGHMVILALEDEGVRDELFYQEVNISQVKAQDMKMDDVELVMELADTLGIDFGGGREKDAIDRLVEKRIESVGSGPLSEVSESVSDGGGSSDELEEVKERLDRLSKQVAEQDSSSKQESNGKSEETSSVDSSNEKDLDDVFGSDEDTQDKAEDSEEDEEAGGGLDLSDDDIGMDVEVPPEEGEPNMTTEEMVGENDG